MTPPDFDPNQIANIQASQGLPNVYQQNPNQMMQPNTQSMMGSGASTGGKAGSLLGALYNYRQLRKRRRRGVIDITPDEVKDIAAETGARANTAKVSNYNTRLGQINTGQSALLNRARNTARTAGELTNAAVASERLAGEQRQQLEREGAQTQSQNRGLNMSAREQIGQYKLQSKQNYDRDIAAYKEAIAKNAGNFINSVEQDNQNAKAMLGRMFLGV